jgi:hypothetical protein
MNFSMRRLTVSVLLVLVLLGSVGETSARSARLPARQAGGEALAGARPQVVLYADPRQADAPPILAPQMRQPQADSATITVTYLPNVAAWPADAITAFEAAAAVWESLLVSNVAITVEAKWTDMGSTRILGMCGANNYHANFTGAPQPNTWYVAALANKLIGRDIDLYNADIYAEFNSTFSWSFATSGSPPPYGFHDFMTVALHELAHGLGMIGSFTVDTTSGAGSVGWGVGVYPAAYDRYLAAGDGSLLLDPSRYPNPSPALGAQLTSDDVYFSGPHARAANGGANPQLFAPNPWMGGSSGFHLGEVFNGTENRLMTYSLAWGEVTHNPGPIVSGIFHDIGWFDAPAPATATYTATSTRSATYTRTPTVSPTASRTATATSSATATATSTATSTATTTPTASPTATASPSATASATATALTPTYAPPSVTAAAPPATAAATAPPSPATPALPAASPTALPLKSTPTPPPLVPHRHWLPYVGGAS